MSRLFPLQSRLSLLPSSYWLETTCINQGSAPPAASSGRSRTASAVAVLQHHGRPHLHLQLFCALTSMSKTSQSSQCARLPWPRGSVVHRQEHSQHRLSLQVSRHPQQQHIRAPKRPKQASTRRSQLAPTEQERDWSCHAKTHASGPTWRRSCGGR